MRQLIAGFLCVATLAAPVVAGASGKQKSPLAPPPKKAATSAPGIPRLSEAMVQAALNAWNGASTSFTGLLELEDDSSKLYVSSARQLIARKGYELPDTKGKYTPPPDARLDVVSIICGDNDRSELFECVRVTVKAQGKIIKPLSYRAANDTYQNAFGAKWRARDVVASYPVTGLENGFTVQYADGQGVEWEFEVTAEDAAKELLLTLKPQR